MTYWDHLVNTLCVYVIKWRERNEIWNGEKGIWWCDKWKRQSGEMMSCEMRKRRLMMLFNLELPTYKHDTWSFGIWSMSSEEEEKFVLIAKKITQILSFRSLVSYHLLCNQVAYNVSAYIAHNMLSHKFTGGIDFWMLFLNLKDKVS